MCDIRPGPRCPYDMKKKIESRENRLAKEIKDYGVGSPQAHLAQQKLVVAQAQYDATQEGIDLLAKEISVKNYDEDLIERYKKAKITNEIQHLSVAEVKNGRAELIAQTYSNFFGYNREEVYSVLETLREEQEKQTLNTYNETHLQKVDSNTWEKYVDNLETNVKSYAANEINLNALQMLRNIKTLPPRYIFKAYTSFPKVTKTVKEHQANSDRNIALLLGTTESTIAEKRTELKKEYSRKYSNATKQEDRPNPPEHWIRGESNTAGFMNNPDTRYAPHDAASMYATYKMMYDTEAIPDYKKQARTFSFLQETKDNLIIDTYTSAGKPITRQTLPRTASSINNLEKTLQGSTLVTEKMETKIKHPHLSLEGVASQHLDLPSYSKENVAAALKEDNLNTVHLLTKTINHSKRLWNNKLARRNA